MTPHRFTIEYRTGDGERWREVFVSDAEGARWFRRLERYEDGQWIRERYEEITPPTLGVRPVGLGRTITGP